MPENCSSCSREWQKRYELAVKRFDKSLNKAVTVSIVSLCVAVICIILMVFCVAKTQKFINQFQYVEETEYQIQQGDGINTAIIDSEGSEVNIYDESYRKAWAHDEPDNQEDR